MTMNETDCIVQMQGDGWSSLPVIQFVHRKDIERKSKIQTNGTIYNTLVQLLGYAGDLDIVARSFATLNEAFMSLKKWVYASMKK